MSEAAQARAAAMPVEVKKDSLSQLQNGDWKLTLKVAAQDMPAAMLEALPGTRYQTAFVEVADNEEPVNRKPDKRPFHELSRPQQAGILCGDWRFQRWIGYHEKYGGIIDFGCSRKQSITRDGAAEYVRRACNVRSRSDLDTTPTAWDALVSEYRQDTGLEATP